MPDGVLRVRAHRRHRHRQVLRHAAARRGRAADHRRRPPGTRGGGARVARAARRRSTRFGRGMLHRWRRPRSREARRAWSSRDAAARADLEACPSRGAASHRRVAGAAGRRTAIAVRWSPTSRCSSRRAAPATSTPWWSWRAIRRRQRARLIARDGLADGEADRRIAAQWPIPTRCAARTTSSKTDGTFADTDARSRRWSTQTARRASTGCQRHLTSTLETRTRSTPRRLAGARALETAPACRCAAVRVFFISIAMVSGPTPPGTGVSAPATSATAGCTSPTATEPFAAARPGDARAPPKKRDASRFVGDAVHADVDDRRARLDELRRDEPGAPDGGDEDVGLARDRRQVGRARVADGDRGVACSSSSAIGLPTMSLRPITTARLPAIGHAVAARAAP